MSKTYKQAGVDIDKGNRFAEFIASYNSPAVSKAIGGFAGGFELDPAEYNQPVIMTSTDGVGTKLLIAQKLKIYDTVGIDLVAMCVNDLIASGAKPRSFLDYIACGRIDETVLQDLVKGIITGCEQAECELTGGETAEMPDMYADGDFDLAGFAVGVAEKKDIMPMTQKIRAGSALFGLPSTGIHSNGFSLARKALQMDSQETLKELLTPTKIYVRDFEKLSDSGMIIGAAHITGGGLSGNIQRVLSENLTAELTYTWQQPDIFKKIQAQGGIDTAEMRRVFNLGIGMVLIVSDPDGFAGHAAKTGVNILEIGSVKSC